MSAFTCEKNFADYAEFVKFIDWCKSTGRPYKAYRCLIDKSWDVVYGDRPYRVTRLGALQSRGVAGIVD